MFLPWGWGNPLQVLDYKYPSRLLFPIELSVVFPGLQWVRMEAKGCHPIIGCLAGESALGKGLEP